MSFFEQKIKNKPNRFEGWYVRFVEEDLKTNEAFILAFSTHQDDPHAFTQYFNGIAKTNNYTKHPLETFAFKDETVHLEKHRLSEQTFLFSTENHTLNLTFSNVQKPHRSAMSFLRFLPLECYQEVIVMEAKATGERTVEGKTTPVRGTIYIEKTYGRKFPKQWFWLQTHHFDVPEVRLSLAGGSVPTLKYHPFGFFCLVEQGAQTYRFATYNRSKFNAVDLGDKVVFTIRKGAYNLRLEVSDHDPTALVGPNDYGAMNLTVYESLQSHVKLTLTENDQTLIQATSKTTGFEWMGQN